MANLFDSANYSTTEPTKIIAGDRIAWKRSDLHSDYPNDEYTLSYILKRDTSGSEGIDITASASGNDYLIEVASATTATWAADTYKWESFITRDSDSQRHRLGWGSCVVHPDFSSATTDPRSHAQKVLEAIEAVLEGRASKDQDTLTVEGMTLVRTPVEDLLMLRSKYRGIYAREQRAERMRQGKKHKGQIFTRFA